MESPHSMRGPSPEASGEAPQHSAGPWHLGPGDYGVVEVRGPDGWIVPLGYEPNARLIAAAPEMLAALRALLATSDLNFDSLEPDTVRAIQATRAVIAKVSA